MEWKYYELMKEEDKEEYDYKFENKPTSFCFSMLNSLWIIIYRIMLISMVWLSADAAK